MALRAYNPEITFGNQSKLKWAPPSPGISYRAKEKPYFQTTGYDQAALAIAGCNSS